VDGTVGGSAARSGSGWGAIVIVSPGDVTFDTTVFRSGTASLRLSTGSAVGSVTVASYRTNPPVASSLFELFTLLPNTLYVLSAYIRTNNVAALGAFIECREFTAAAATVVTNTSNKLSGTDTTWRSASVTFTTSSTTRFGGFFLRNNVVGNTSDAWFDDITLIPASLGRVQASGRVAA
jgi:hypothetical protein